MNNEQPTTPFLFRRMKFITNNQVEYIPRAPFPVENFIHYTKEIIDSHLKSIFHTSKNNLSAREYASLRILRNSTLITIKPADKILGIVILDTNDYVLECIRRLSSTTYRELQCSQNPYPSNYKT